MAEIVVDRLLGGEATFPGADMSTKLKLLGVDVASFGDAFGTTPGALDVVYADPVAGVYKKLVLSDDARTLLGGDPRRRRLRVRGAAADGRAVTWASTPAPTSCPRAPGPRRRRSLPDDANVCSCNNVSAGAHPVRRHRGRLHRPGRRQGLHEGRHELRLVPPAGEEARHQELESAGIEVSKALCEHFDMSRAELFDVVRVSGIAHLQRDHRAARQRPRLRHLQAGGRLDPRRRSATGYILDGEQAALQDTNDHVLANMQKDGTYSVVPAHARAARSPRRG